MDINLSSCIVLFIMHISTVMFTLHRECSSSAWNHVSETCSLLIGSLFCCRFCGLGECCTHSLVSLSQRDRNTNVAEVQGGTVKVPGRWRGDYMDSGPTCAMQHDRHGGCKHFFPEHLDVGLSGEIEQIWQPCYYKYVLDVFALTTVETWDIQARWRFSSSTHKCLSKLLEFIY